jgi:hypothetical protein
LTYASSYLQAAKKFMASSLCLANFGSQFMFLLKSNDKGMTVQPLGWREAN